MNIKQAFLLLGNICSFDKGGVKSESKSSLLPFANELFLLPSDIKGFL